MDCRGTTGCRPRWQGIPERGLLTCALIAALLLTATTPAAAQETTAGQAGTTTAPAAQSTPVTSTTTTTTTKPTLPVEGDFNEVHIKPKPATPPATAAPTANATPPVGPALAYRPKPIKVDVDLVLVPVTITDPMDRLVTGLEKENFQLWDAGEAQEIKYFSCEDAPISVGVIFDMSGSMADKIDKSRAAVGQFFRTSNPDDEFLLIAFNETPMLASDFTRSVDEIQGKLVMVQPRRMTALLDAIYLGITKMKGARHQRKALLVISDGGDNHSRYTESEIESMVKEADVQIYGIGIFDPTPGTPEERQGPQLLSEITDMTGGRTFSVDSVNELADVATKIGVELRNQYVLGYRPKKAVHDGQWRKIRVKLNPPKGLPPLSVYAKTGYYAPND